MADIDSLAGGSHRKSMRIMKKKWRVIDTVGCNFHCIYLLV
jgi:hypothetical protein